MSYKMEKYLGDGVYAVYDGYGIKLDLRGQDNTTEIYLESETLESLIQFRDLIKDVKGIGK